MEKATIFDYARMCKGNPKTCKLCPLSGRNCIITEMTDEELIETNELILNWCKEHPVKTRQDEFLKMFPNAKIVDGVVTICPKNVETTLRCSVKSCEKCSKEYWLAEVDEKDAK